MHFTLLGDIILAAKASVLKHRKKTACDINFWRHQKEKLQTKRREFPH